MEFNIKNLILERRGQQQMFYILMAAIIAIVAAVFMILWFKGTGSNAFEGIGTTIDSFGDCDKDGIANYYDKCPCVFGGQEYDDFDGCPSAKEVECTEEQAKACSE